MARSCWPSRFRKRRRFSMERRRPSPTCDYLSGRSILTKRRPSRLPRAARNGAGCRSLARGRRRACRRSQAEAEDAADRLTALMPPAWLETSGDSDFDIVSSLLDQMVAAVAAGQYQQAESARIEAYAIFETGPEKRLLAFTPTEAQRVERLFWEGTAPTPDCTGCLPTERASMRSARRGRCSTPRWRPRRRR